MTERVGLGRRPARPPAAVALGSATVVFAAAFALTLAFAPLVAAPASAAVPAGARADDGFVVKLREGASSASVADGVGARLVNGLSRGRAVLRPGTGRSLGTVLAQLQRDPRVEWAEPNMRYAAAEQPNDPCLVALCPGTAVNQWAPSVIKAQAAWDVTHGSASVLVAVIDGGVDGSHPQLAGKVVFGPDYTGTAQDDCWEHGTHVAGTIAAVTNDGTAVAGIGWNTRVLAIRALSYDSSVDECTGTLSSIAKAVDAAVQMGAKVVNLSLAGPFDSKTIRESVKAAVRAGLVVVAAAGNEAQQGNPVEYPAAYPEVLAVAASTPDDKTAFFSERGSWVDVAAPGYRIVSTVPGGGYDEMSGTSMATPHVAAAAALVFAFIPGISGFDVASRIQLSSDPYSGAGGDVRFGRLNILRALVTNGPGYWMVATDGGIFAFGESGFYGSTGGIKLNQPIFAMAATPRRQGYWFVARDGGIFNYGDAGFYGSLGATSLKAAIVGLTATPSGLGYWMAAADGAVFPFGDAKQWGSPAAKVVTAPIVGMAATASGNGYWLVGSDGAVYAFGDAGLYGSMGGKPLNRPIVGMAPTASGLGYWLVATDGGIFAFGDATFHGSTGGLTLNKPIVGMKPTPSGDGYWLVASDGGIFAYNAGYFGSMGGKPLNRPVVGIG
ncbi:MAG: thermitase [Acidimicrobiaceae bacterium]|nr:thermitase [Acidimicrobiaceae bacterium]